MKRDTRRTEVWAMKRERPSGWTRYVVTRAAEHAPGRSWTYYGHVRVWAARVGPFTLYRSFMRARWPQVHASLRGGE